MSSARQEDGSDRLDPATARALLGSPGALHLLAEEGRLPETIAAALPDPNCPGLSVDLLRRRVLDIADAVIAGTLRPAQAAVRMQAVYTTWEMTARGARSSSRPVPRVLK